MSFAYCLTMAFLGSVRIISSSSSDNASRVLTTGRPADEFRNQSETEQIFRFDRVDGFPRDGLGVAKIAGMKSHVFPPSRRWTILSKPTKAPPQMKRIFSVFTWMYSWWGCLRPPCGGTLQTVPSKNFQQRLLDAFSGDIARNADILCLAPDLVDFIDVDDAHLGALDIVVGILQ